MVPFMQRRQNIHSNDGLNYHSRRAQARSAPLLPKPARLPLPRTTTLHCGKTTAARSSPTYKPARRYLPIQNCLTRGLLPSSVALKRRRAWLAAIPRLPTFSLLSAGSTCDSLAGNITAALPRDQTPSISRTSAAFVAGVARTISR